MRENIVKEHSEEDDIEQCQGSKCQDIFLSLSGSCKSKILVTNLIADVTDVWWPYIA